MKAMDHTQTLAACVCVSNLGARGAPPKRKPPNDCANGDQVRLPAFREDAPTPATRPYIIQPSAIVTITRSLRRARDRAGGLDIRSDRTRPSSDCRSDAWSLRPF